MTTSSKSSSVSTDGPEYKAPSTGIFRLLPAALVPYAELMRIDRPAGYYAFFWHYAIGIAFAACIAPEPPTPSEVSKIFAYMALWVLIYRGAVCAWNDNIDQEFDRQVARCRFRPIARGAVSTAEGHLFTMVQTMLCGVMLVHYPATVFFYATVMTIMLGIYPFGKRMTDFPQVILGFAFAIPIFMCSAALGTDPLFQLSSGSEDTFPKLYGSLCLYGANCLWTVIFDTVYAHQDIKDDIKAGVKSLAVRLGDKTKLGCGILSAIQVGLLIAAGQFCNLDWPFYMVACGGAGLSLFAMLFIVNLERPSSCAWWFGPGSRLVGASVVGGLMGHYILRLG